MLVHIGLIDNGQLSSGEKDYKVVREDGWSMWKKSMKQHKHQKFRDKLLSQYISYALP